MQQLGWLLMTAVLLFGPDRLTNLAVILLAMTLISGYPPGGAKIIKTGGKEL